MAIVAVRKNGKELYHTVMADKKNKAAQQLGRLGGKARSAAMTAEERSDLAKKAIRKRWADYREKLAAEAV